MTIPPAHSPPDADRLAAWIAAVGSKGAEVAVARLAERVRAHAEEHRIEDSSTHVEVPTGLPYDSESIFALRTCPFVSSWFEGPDGSERVRVPLACVRELLVWTPPAPDPPREWPAEARRLHCLLEAHEDADGWEGAYVTGCSKAGCLDDDGDAVWLAGEERFATIQELETLLRERPARIRLRWASMREIYDHAKSTWRMHDDVSETGEHIERACVRAACAWIGRAVVSASKPPPDEVAFLLSFDRKRPAGWRPIEQSLPTPGTLASGGTIYFATSGNFSRRGVSRPPMVPDLNGTAPIHPILFTSAEVRAAVVEASADLASVPRVRPGEAPPTPEDAALMNALFQRLFERHAPMIVRCPGGLATSQAIEDEVKEFVATVKGPSTARRIRAILGVSAREKGTGIARAAADPSGSVYRPWEILPIDRAVARRPYATGRQLSELIESAEDCEPLRSATVPASALREAERGLESTIARLALPDGKARELDMILSEWNRSGILVVDGRRFALLVSPDEPGSAERLMREAGFRRHALPWPGGIEGVWVREEVFALKRKAVESFGS